MSLVTRNNDFNNIASPLWILASTYPEFASFVEPGATEILVEGERMKCLKVEGGYYQFERGSNGSAVEAHGDSEDIYRLSGDVAAPDVEAPDTGFSGSAPGPIGEGTPSTVRVTVIRGGVEDAVVAAGGGQAGAAQLSAAAWAHRLGTVSVAGDAVKLPTAVAGEKHVIVNPTATRSHLYGKTTATINGGAFNDGVQIPAGYTALAECIVGGASGEWAVIVVAAAGFSPAAPGAIGGTTPAAATFTTLAAQDAEFQTLASINQIYLEWAGGITAHAGGSQAAATVLDASVVIHRVSVCATNDDSVRLPAGLYKGRTVWVHNRGAADLKVYGAGTETINEVATATGVTIPAGKSACFQFTDAADWDMLLGA